MKAFTSKTLSIGGSIYFLIPSDVVKANNIEEDQFLEAQLTKLTLKPAEPNE